MDVELLHYIYHFPGLDLPTSQDAAVCKKIAKLFLSFTEHMLQDGNLDREPRSGYSREAFQLAYEKMQNICNVSTCIPRVEWFPKYGCAVIFHTAKGQWTKSHSIDVIGLDQHEQEVHTGKKKYQFSSRSKSFAMLHVGECETDTLDDLWGRFNRNFEGRSRRTGDRRTAAGGRQGHQRTPAFVHAVLRDTLYMKTDTPPIGGFTDVGLHTGGEERDTCFAIVQFVFQWFLEDFAFCEPHHFDVVMLHFKMYLAHEAFSTIKTLNTTGTRLNDEVNHMFTMLKTMAIDAASLSDLDFNVSAMYNEMKDMMNEIRDTFKRWDDFHLEKNSIKNCSSGFEPRNPKFTIPDFIPPQKTEDLSESEMRTLLTTNLGQTILPEKIISDDKNIHLLIDQFASWSNEVESKFKSSTTFTFIFMRQIEHLLWDLSEEYLQKPLPLETLNNLMSVIDSYRKAVNHFWQEREKSYSAKVLLNCVRSVELLLVWLGYCLVFNSLKSHHAHEMRGFGVGLSFTDLKYLVLHDGSHMKILKKVAIFLKDNNVEAMSLFSMKTKQDWDSPTLRFGQRYAEKHLLSIYEDDVKDANHRIDKHWEEVKRKQNLAKLLREELLGLERELKDAQDHLNCRKFRNISSFARSHSLAYNAAQIDVSNAADRVESKLEEIRIAERAPDPVLQPLPENKSKALGVLFFLYMPPEFCILSRLTLTAQQLLIPKLWQCSVHKCVEDKSKKLPWKYHYDNHQYCQYHSPVKYRKGNQQHFDLSMWHATKDPKSIGPEHVDRFVNKSQGIWYPDECNAHFLWYGGCHTWDQYNSLPFNPFLVKPDEILPYFTEKLEPECHRHRHHLQWSVEMSSDVEKYLKHHGNKPYASLYSKPKWLSKQGFLDFTSMRRFPNLALRKLCVALKHGSLPFENISVQKLLRQTLFQIGDLSFDELGLLHFDWRKDFNRTSETCCNILHQLSEIYSAKPNFFKACIFIGELSSYFNTIEEVPPSEKHMFQEITRLLAASAIKWAQDSDDEVKQVIFYQTAIMSIANEANLISDQDILNLLECIVRSRNVHIPTKTMTSNPAVADMQVLNELCVNRLSNCLNVYIDRVSSNHIFLSKSVHFIIASSPRFEHWHQEESSSVSFSALGDDGHKYSINILSGVLLVDGLPPDQLPVHITEDKTYRKVFGNQNFKVVVKDGAFETVQPTNGYYYRFYKVNTTLVVVESERAEDYDGKDYWENQLELVDAKELESDLPEKLSKTYSHWISRKDCTVIFRSFNFRDRQIFYILDGSCCKHIPRHVKFGHLHWSKILKHPDVTDNLLVHKSPFLKIFSRIETTEMMLTSSSQEKNEYSIFLHRFGLTFTFDIKCQKFHCKEIIGYHLKKEQHFPKEFHGLHQYLVLESDVDKMDMKILVPFGTISTDSKDTNSFQITYRNTSNNVPIHDNDPFQEFKFFEYDIHPRFSTVACSSICGRIQLAGLYLATGFIVPISDRNMTGEEKAIEILRQCWVNRPLTGEEKSCLENVSDLAKGKSSTVFLLCSDIFRCTSISNFLHGESESSIDQQDYAVEASAYLHHMKVPTSTRLFLTEVESHRCLASSARIVPERFIKRAIGTHIDLESSPVKRSDVHNIQKMISCLWIDQKVDFHFEEFPLPLPKDSDLEKTVLDELERSWYLYLQCKKSTISINEVTEVLGSLEKIQREIICLLHCIEHYLTKSLNDCCDNKCDHWHKIGFELLKLVNILPFADKKDFAGIACFPQRLKSFNPLLSKKSLKSLHETIIIWLELCVLNDKLKFLLSFDHKEIQRNQIAIDELSSEREWSTEEHPYWLVFEVEQGIRIRPEQYQIANHLMNNSGQSIQLNMGLGKTRVILPMLILACTFSKNKKIPRLTILSTLFQEACDYFQNALTASILERKLFVIPFQRDIELNLERVLLMRDTIDNCQHDNGFLVIAPEHHLSLQLKGKELFRNKNLELSGAVQGLFQDFNYFDVIDEIDEVLHHRYQLIYSIGEPQLLPQGQHRWKATQGLLQVLQKIRLPQITKVFDHLFPEAFPQIKIGENLEPIVFREQITLELFNNPPLELDWLKGHNKKDQIFQVITDPTTNPDVLSTISENHYFDILSLRGLLAFDILLHTLKKRHRVDYGINENGRKRLSVPFRGADTPSIRSEFSHPDCAITLTILAYYQRGLRVDDVEEAFNTLLKFGRNAKILIYNEWLHLSKSRMPQNSFASIRHVDQIDMTNSSQIELLHKFYSKNPSTINFWLNFCVFPQEMDNYKERMVGNSWHLANNEQGHIVGFSGTNDNHWILPLQIRQHLPWDAESNVWKSILSTNGRMLGTLIEKTLSCEELCQEGKACDVILNHLKQSWFKGERVDAIIDSGALLAGKSNFSVAQFIMSEFILKKNDSHLRGVTFFNELVKPNGCWMILDTSGRCTPKDQAPLSEFETFAIFDEPRCRGVDLKLHKDAVAVVTLGKNMCKDKFMQAAGRMRKLSSTQRLRIVGEAQIFEEIRGLHQLNKKSILSIFASQSSVVDIKHVLSWIMINTIQSIWKGLSMWIEQGLFFASESNPHHAVLKEIADLSELYGYDLRESSIADRAIRSQNFHHVRTGGNQISSKAKIIEQILERSITLGNGFTILSTGVDEECERELERELEREMEEEEQEEKMEPRNETDWNYEGIFNVDSPTKLSTEIWTLSDAIRQWTTGLTTMEINWSKDVFCTTNFFVTISSSTNHLNNFLRIPDCFVCFPGGQKLLLSDREASYVLKIFQNREKKRWAGNIDYHFSHCVFESDHCKQSLLRQSTNSWTGSEILSCKDASSVQLFNGECSYPNSQKQALKEILSTAQSSKDMNKMHLIPSCNPQGLILARAKIYDFDRSDLERVCSEIDTESEMNKD